MFRGNWPIWIKQQLGSRNERCRNQFTIGGKKIKIFRNIEKQKMCTAVTGRNVNNVHLFHSFQKLQYTLLGVPVSYNIPRRGGGGGGGLIELFHGVWSILCQYHEQLGFF